MSLLHEIPNEIELATRAAMEFTNVPIAEWDFRDVCPFRVSYYTTTDPVTERYRYCINENEHRSPHVIYVGNNQIYIERGT